MARSIPPLALMIAIVTMASTATASIVTNGSFETFVSGTDGGTGRQVFQVGIHDTNITGWTLEGSGDVYLHITPDIGVAIGENFNFAQAGNVYLDLSGGIGGGVSGNVLARSSSGIGGLIL